jgi:hypothetical protein
MSTICISSPIHHAILQRLSPCLHAAAVALPTPVHTVTPQPSLSAAAAQLAGPSPPAAGLAAAMRVLAVPGHGNLVVTGGLPIVGPTEQLGEAFKTWFNRMYMRVRCLLAFMLTSMVCVYVQGCDTAGGLLYTLAGCSCDCAARVQLCGWCCGSNCSAA